MNKNLICIVCPRGCLIKTSAGGSEVEGYGCPKGLEYARQELSEPKRMITSTVRTVSDQLPRLAVRLSTEIPKTDIFDCMKRINAVLVTGPCRPGDVLEKDICGAGVDLLASGGLEL